MTVFCSKQMGDKEMKKYIALYGMLAVAISSGNAFGTTTLAKCCSGNRCTSAYVVGCKTCNTNLDCGDIVVSECPDECPNATWTLVNAGGIVMAGVPRYETRCGGLITNRKCEYRCAAGAYGSPTSSTSGCSICPTIVGEISMVGAVYGNSEAGSTDITDCYAEADTEYSDSTGKFRFTDDCYYTK